MHYGIVSRLLGAIVLALALAFLVCFGVGFFPSAHPGEVAAREQMLVCAGIAVVPWRADCSGLGAGRAPVCFRKEALAVIGVGWLLASVVGALCPTS